MILTWSKEWDSWLFTNISIEEFDLLTTHRLGEFFYYSEFFPIGYLIKIFDEAKLELKIII